MTTTPEDDSQPRPLAAAAALREADRSFYLAQRAHLRAVEEAEHERRHMRRMTGLRLTRGSVVAGEEEILEGVRALEEAIRALPVGLRAREILRELVDDERRRGEVPDLGAYAARRQARIREVEAALRREFPEVAATPPLTIWDRDEAEDLALAELAGLGPLALVRQNLALVIGAVILVVVLLAWVASQ